MLTEEQIRTACRAVEQRVVLSTHLAWECVEDVGSSNRSRFRAVRERRYALLRGLFRKQPVGKKLDGRLREDRNFRGTPHHLIVVFATAGFTEDAYEAAAGRKLKDVVLLGPNANDDGVEVVYADGACTDDDLALAEAFRTALEHSGYGAEAPADEAVDESLLLPDITDVTSVRFFSALPFIARRRRAVRDAQRSVLLGSFTFHDRNLADALKDAAARGVEVKVLLDPTVHGKTAAALARGGVTTYVRRNHAKIVVVDDELVLLGSSNVHRTTGNLEANLELRSRSLAARLRTEVDSRLRPEDRVRAT